MKFWRFIFSVVWLAGFSATAQVSVDVTLDQQQFLPGESLPVAVHVTNHSGQTLHLGAKTNWLTFDVESVDGFVVVKNADPPVQGAFDLGSSEIATKRVNLTPYFVLTQPGSYHVTVTVRIPQWDSAVVSPAKNFDVINGAKLWSQVFGLPAPANATNQPPEVRKFTLEEANYLRSQLRLYVQVSNESGGRVFKVLPLCQMVSFSHPDAQLDRFNNLHVLCQSGAKVFTYAVITPDGDVSQRDLYDYVSTRPRLSANDNGDVVVVGGRLRPNPDAALPPTATTAPAKP
jgi:hypothetical protein